MSRKKVFWQQAAGDQDRNYVHLCLKWGVILNGPGNPGPWNPADTSNYDEMGRKRKKTDLKRFCEDIKDGDIIALRLGTRECYAVGIAIGDYEWSDAFGDVDGWDIQHVRRVNWVWSSLNDPKVFPTYTFKQGDTTQPLTAEEVLSWIEELNLTNSTKQSVSLLPRSSPEIEFSDVFDFLFDEGVGTEAINQLMDEMTELVRIAKWYQRADLNPSEAETIAYLAVPFLRALGWTPQKMAVEWNHVDIALFSHLPRIDENLTVVVEAKRRGNSCLTAKSQAEEYARSRGCDRLIVTDGIRFGIFGKNDDKFDLIAYLNITRLRNSYPIYNCFGAREAILAMTPEKAIGAK